MRCKFGAVSSMTPLRRCSVAEPRRHTPPSHPGAEHKIDRLQPGVCHHATRAYLRLSQRPCYSDLELSGFWAWGQLEDARARLGSRHDGSGAESMTKSRPV